jgi:hypothetical protein
MISREDLRTELAKACHDTWLWQRKRGDALKEAGTPEPPADPTDPNPTKHDFERADDLIKALERLGVYP